MSGTPEVPSMEGLPAFTEFDREDCATLEEAADTVDSIEGLRAITGRGVLFGSMLVGEAGGEGPRGGMVGADGFCC